MTDREKVERLGDYINGLLEEIETLKGVMDYRSQHPESAQGVPLEEMKRKVSGDEMFQRTVAAHKIALLHALGHETEASALIQVLCGNYFLE